MNVPLSTPGGFATALIALWAIGTACAVLSIFVVLLKWSFMGEGISHAGIGGYGTAAVLTLIFPALDNDAANFGIAILFCFVTAMAIAWGSRRRAVSSDAAIGVVVLSSLAWGAVAFAIRAHARGPGAELGWQVYLIGTISNLTTQSMFAAVCTSLFVLLVLGAFNRQILLYCLDPILAQVSGVPAGVIHYLMAFLLALVIISGMPLMGNLLAPALVILPGAMALAVSVRLRTVIALAVSAVLAAVAVGLAVEVRWPFIEAGPAIVLALFAEFGVALLLRRS